MSPKEHEFYSALGRLIARARGDVDMTQAELARRLGLSRASVTNMEVGRQPVQAHVLAMISQELHVPVEDLMPMPTRRASSEIDAKLEAIPQADRALIEEMMRQ